MSTGHERMSGVLDSPTEVVLGAGSLDTVGALAAAMCRRPVVVCGQRALRGSPQLDAVALHLRREGLDFRPIAGITPDCDLDQVHRSADQARLHGADAVIAVGGGSVLDAGKAVALSAIVGPVGELLGTPLPEEATALPVLAVPTTVGSGAEVTKGAIVTDAARRLRTGLRGRQLYPVYAVVDPTCFRSLPSAVLSDGVFDAFAHAVETFVCVAATLQTRAVSLRAARLITDLVLAGSLLPTDTDRMTGLARAAVLAGRAVATTGTCLPHRVQQALAGQGGPHASHGRMLSALYPGWIRALEATCPAEAGLLAQELRVPSLSGLVGRMRAALEMTETPRDLGLTPATGAEALEHLTGALGNDPVLRVDPDAASALLLPST